MSGKSSSSTTTIGPGLVTLLTITFVILKALGHLTWSWWWVFSPLWISAALTTVILGGAGIIVLIAWWFGK